MFLPERPEAGARGASYKRPILSGGDLRSGDNPSRACQRNARVPEPHRRAIAAARLRAAACAGTGGECGLRGQKQAPARGRVARALIERGVLPLCDRPVRRIQNADLRGFRGLRSSEGQHRHCYADPG